MLESHANPLAVAVEVEFLDTVFARVPSMKDFCQTLHKKYCMNESSFTELDYRIILDEMLFNCRDISRLRINLPFQLVGRHCNAATMILANTFEAFSRRPEEGSAKLNTLVLENVTDIAICHLWTNPSDVQNIMDVMEVLEHLVMTIRRHETEPQRVEVLSLYLWDIIRNAEELKSLCLVGMELDDRPPRRLKQTKATNMAVEEWQARRLPAPEFLLPQLTSLELRRVEVLPTFFRSLARNFGSTLKELYLNEVYLKAETGVIFNQDTSRTLWIGLPNQRPALGCHWIATILRESLPNLQICRAAFLSYDLYLREDASDLSHEFDFYDPCLEQRSFSQRFVEVVMGIKQGPGADGEPVRYLPEDEKNDHLLKELVICNGPMWLTDYDCNAYQTAVANPTSAWYKSIDGLFTNCNNNTLDDLHFIADTACQGMNEIHRRRNEWSAGNSVVNEFTENLLGRQPPAVDG
jgi:hypothetical protein